MHRVHDPVLAETIHAADALFEPQWCPGEFEIDDPPAALMKVQPFTCGIGRDE